MKRQVRPLFGLLYGMIIAVFFTALALIGRSIFGQSFPDKPGLTLGGLILLYFLSGAIGGSLVGLLLPLTVRRIGAVFVGMIAVAPYYLIDSFLASQVQSGRFYIEAGIFASVVVGGIVGWIVWEWDQPDVNPGPDDAGHIQPEAVDTGVQRGPRVARMVGIVTMALAATTCTALAESDEIVQAGFAAFGVGFAVLLVAQILIWVYD